jgi:hypothetical protein
LQAFNTGPVPPILPPTGRIVRLAFGAICTRRAETLWRLAETLLLTETLAACGTLRGLLKPFAACGNPSRLAETLRGLRKPFAAYGNWLRLAENSLCFRASLPVAAQNIKYKNRLDGSSELPFLVEAPASLVFFFFPEVNVF